MTPPPLPLRTADFDFELPPELVAQAPLPGRDDSRLLVVDRERGTLAHRRFPDLLEYLRAGDALVLNTTKVRRARLLGRRDSGAPAEVLLLRPLAGATRRFEAMVHPGGKLKPGRRVHVAEDLVVEILEVTDRRTRIVELQTPLSTDDALERYGHVPLPPYIVRPDEPEDAGRYQTVYAREGGSAAAPTAGLHFTPELLEAARARGVRLVNVLLHVGAGTFKPVETDDPSAHVMHEEWYRVSPEAAAELATVRAEGGRIWAVGTTGARTLESATSAEGAVQPSEGETRLFIRPGYHFRAVDKLVTNFHLPRSTLIMLVAAFAGYELTMRAYKEAVDARYRFFSYGDAMVVL